MRLRLLSLLLLAAPLACARTEVAGFPQGDVQSPASTSSGASSTSSGVTTGGSLSGTSGVASTSSGTSSTTVSTGTSGAGQTCAPCSSASDCAPELECAGAQQGGGVCLAPCAASSPCADPSTQCLGGYCLPSDFCLGTGSTTGNTGTSSTTGSCDLQTCFQACGALNELCDPSTCTCQSANTSGTSGTTGSCDLQTCFQACGALNELCDPSTCTCQGGNTSGTLGGTIGTTGASGTSGTTGGGTDCRTLGCGYGETCQQFGRFANTYYACACNPGGANGATDSCAGNPSGADVCDQSTRQCRAGRDYDACNPTLNVQTCASGYACVATSSASGVCLQSCSSSTDCSAAFTICSAGLCVIDVCGPNSGNGDYYQSCTLATSGDGTCQPLPEPDGGVFGLCVINGSLQPGDACPGEGSDRNDQCVAGSLCVPRGNALPDGGSDARCFETCNASNNPGTYAKSCSGSFSQCTPDQRGLRSATPDPGVCVP